MYSHPSHLTHDYTPLSDSDVAVRRKAAFLFDDFFIPCAPVAMTRTPGTRVQGSFFQPGETVHPIPMRRWWLIPCRLTRRQRRVLAHRMIQITIRELTAPTPYGLDGDEGDGGDVDLEEKLMRCVYYGSSCQALMMVFAICCICMCRRIMGHLTIRRRIPRTILDARRTASGESELGLGEDELREIRNALT